MGRPLCFSRGRRRPPFACAGLLNPAPHPPHLPFSRRAQITASVTFLPLLSDPCTFDLLVYTAAASDVPAAWEESEPRLIATGAAADVKLRSFTTRVHRVDAMVSYRMDD